MNNYVRKQLYTFVRLRRLQIRVFYFLGGKAALHVPLSANPCSNTGSVFPTKPLITAYRPARYTPFGVLKLQTPKMSVLFFRFYVVKHTPTAWYSV